MFHSILENTEFASYAVSDIMLCMAAALVLGLVIALVFHLQGESSKGFLLSLAVLPLLVQAVIMMVNGSLGTSVAVLGAFSLVRFRSLPGSSKEICGVFFAMAVGLATAMGCIGFACVLTVIVGVLLLAGGRLLEGFGSGKRTLKVTIPENLDYTTVFDDILGAYTRGAVLQNVKTTNMGSMFELTYSIQMRPDANEKEMIDRIRCKNGNLTVICGREMKTAEL